MQLGIMPVIVCSPLRAMTSLALSSWPGFQYQAWFPLVEPLVHREQLVTAKIWVPLLLLYRYITILVIILGYFPSDKSLQKVHLVLIIYNVILLQLLKSSFSDCEIGCQSFSFSTLNMAFLSSLPSLSSFLFSSRAGCHVVQASLELNIWPRIILKFWSSCLHHPNVEIMGFI